MQKRSSSHTRSTSDTPRSRSSEKSPRSSSQSRREHSDGESSSHSSRSSSSGFARRSTSSSGAGRRSGSPAKRVSKPTRRDVTGKHPLIAVLERSAKTLGEILGEGRFADAALRESMKKMAQFEERYAWVLPECVYTVIRDLRRFCYAIDEEFPIAMPRKLLWQRLVEAWALLADFTVPETRLDAEKTKKRWNEATKRGFAVEFSMPDWLETRSRDEFAELGFSNEVWKETFSALREKPPVTLRTNSLKISVKDLAEKLWTEHGIGTERSPLAHEALILQRFTNVFALPEFFEGLFEVQDAASQSISRLLNVQSGMRVIDACAGAGGKTLHLAALMENKGKIIALDTEERKLAECTKRARRAGISIIEPRVVESTKTIKRLAETADAVLIDAPCSGTGVFRRNPDAKWRLSSESVDVFVQRQKEILALYSKMVKPGGTLLFVTCSVLPSEGEFQIRDFMAAYPGEWLVEIQERLRPGVGSGDGFFVARLKRKQ